jgi:hypothetical protein
MPKVGRKEPIKYITLLQKKKEKKSFLISSAERRLEEPTKTKEEEKFIFNLGNKYILRIGS